MVDNPARIVAGSGAVSRRTAVSLIEAGADSVAVISDILCTPDRVRRARQYLEVLGGANRAASV